MKKLTFILISSTMMHSCSTGGLKDESEMVKIDSETGVYHHVEDILLFESHELTITEAFINPTNTIFTRTVDGQMELFIRVESLNNLEKDLNKKTPLYLWKSTDSTHISEFQKYYTFAVAIDSMSRTPNYSSEEWNNNFRIVDSTLSAIRDELNLKYYDDPVSLNGYLNLEFNFTENEIYSCRDSLNFEFLHPEIIEPID